MTLPPITPHPLVIGLFQSLGKGDIKAAIAAQAKAATAKAVTLPSAATLGDFGVSPTRADRFTCFPGYFGGAVNDPNKDTDNNGNLLVWQVLFLDWSLHRWLLLRLPDIEWFDRVTDDTAAAGERDYVWVAPESLVGRGDSATSAAAVVRGGAFSRAGDLASSLRGDTNTGRGNLFESLDPYGGCGRYSR